MARCEWRGRQSTAWKGELSGVHSVLTRVAAGGPAQLEQAPAALDRRLEPYGRMKSDWWVKSYQRISVSASVSAQG